MSNNLSATLRQVDASGVSIQGAAAAMMKHYDRSSDTAVTQWRNALQSCRDDQLLPLLYVANETLQNSKRNRGPKFLEAFSSILGQALQFLCQRLSPDNVERVRRTTKIWGDRCVYSPRFVGELLRGLEPYREHNRPVDVPDAGTFSPMASPTDTNEHHTIEDSSINLQDDDDSVSSSDDDNAAEITPSTTGPSAEELMMSSDDDDDLFGGEAQLNVTIDASQVNVSPSATAASAATTSTRPTVKKAPGLRRSSGSGKKRKSISILSTQSLQEVFKQLTDFSQQYRKSQTLIQGIPTEDLSPDPLPDDTQLVGDALLDSHARNGKYRKLVLSTKSSLRKVAMGKHALEQEALRYIPWTKTAMAHDAEEMEMCNAVEKQLIELQTIHEATRKVRDERRILKAAEEKQQELEKKRLAEEEEGRKLMEMALAKQEEAEVGMVWNRATGEYQHNNMDETWRD